MKNCLNCGKKIAATISVNGKRKPLAAGRSYCLECSPYRSNNRIQIHIINDTLQSGKKVCSQCGQEKELNDFHKHKSNKLGFTAYCKECNKQRVNSRKKRIKEEAIVYKGGKCAICGYDKYYGAFDFHHLRDKKFGIGSTSFNDIEKIKAELDKCILLCSRCHREVEGGYTVIPSNLLALPGNDPGSSG